MDDYDEANSTYKTQQWNMKSIDGAAGLLHNLQDSYSSAHAGAQIWRGMNQETNLNLLFHGMQDLTVWGGYGKASAIADQGANLIIDYNKNCGGCLKSR